MNRLLDLERLVHDYSQNVRDDYTWMTERVVRLEARVDALLASTTEERQQARATVTQADQTALQLVEKVVRLETLMEQRNKTMAALGGGAGAGGVTALALFGKLMGWW